MGPLGTEACMHYPHRQTPWTGQGRAAQHSGDIRAQNYKDLAQELDALLTGEVNFVACAANAAAAIFHSLPDLNWAGFYFLSAGMLVLGPFQGRPACVRIPLGSGVCGTAAAERRSVLVPDVTAFPSHIACDTASRSELVLPLIHEGILIGVMDLDSPLLARFDAQDQSGCEVLAKIVARHLHPSFPSTLTRPENGSADAHPGGSARDRDLKIR